jgi:hypothetical protein
MTSGIRGRTVGIAALSAGLAFAATSIAAATLLSLPHAAEPIGARIDMMVTAPFQILSSARANGISDTVPQLSEATLDRVKALDREAERLRMTSGMSNIVTSSQVEEAYAGGVQDAIRYGYGESDLEGMLDAVAAATHFGERAADLSSKVREHGIPRKQAEDLAVLAISAGVHSAQRRDDRWIRALSDFVDAKSYRNACADCTETDIADSAQAAFDAMMEVSLDVEERILFSRNDIEDIRRAHVKRVIGDRHETHLENDP